MEPTAAAHPSRCLPEELCRRLFQQLLTAVDFCHRLGIANRDIKLENALIMGNIDEEDIALKLCDFGYSKDELVRSPPCPFLPSNADACAV